MEEIIMTNTFEINCFVLNTGMEKAEIEKQDKDVTI